MSVQLFNHNLIEGLDIHVGLPHALPLAVHLR